MAKKKVARRASRKVSLSRSGPSPAPYPVELEILRKDIRLKAAKLSRNQARHIVNLYYSIQKLRKATASQAKAMEEAEAKNELITFLYKNFNKVERQIKTSLDIYTDQHIPSRWAKTINGIGPIISGCLHANIDVTKAKYAGQVHSFAGKSPSQVWLGVADSAVLVKKCQNLLGGETPTDEHVQWLSGTLRRPYDSLSNFAHKYSKAEGQLTWEGIRKAVSRRPYNADLKQACYWIGQGLILHGAGTDYKGYYDQRKAYAYGMNERGEYAKKAKEQLEKFNFGTETEAYKWYIQGKLSPGHIDSQCRRWLIKLFLTHYHQVAYYERYHVMPAKPYVIGVLGHTGEIECPNWPFTDKKVKE